MKTPLLLVALLGLSGCAASLKSMDRGEWTLVWKDDGKSQELITRDAFEQEIVAGRKRKVEFAIDEKAQVLHEATGPVNIKVGEIVRFRLNEGEHVDLQSDEAVTETLWTENYRVDGWKGDQAVEGKESMVYVRGLKPGKSRLKLVDNLWGTHELEVLVK